MTTDRYRNRLRHARWTWREDHAWNQGKFPKDRRMGRLEKRGARQDDQLETKQEADAVTPDGPDDDPGPPPEVIEAWAKWCRCCQGCRNPPCEGVMTGGMCDEGRCSCDDDYDRDFERDDDNDE